MESYTIIKKIYSTHTEDRVVLLVQKEGQQYAMKRLNLEDDIQKKEVIFNEVKVLENLLHPNIIKCHETFQYEQKLCIVMEYAEGGDLKKLVIEKQQAKQFFDENQIWSMFAQLCLAVKYLHDNKILHRDLKILNVFISKNGLLKLGDFGVSKQLDNQEILTNTHVGTPYYMSPEQCNSNSYNHKVDIWMLGCLLYELCTLEKPFKSDNFLGLIKQITQNDPHPIPDHFSNTMSQLVQVMMQKEPDMRPEINQIISIQEIQNQFKKLKEQYSDVYKEYIFPNPKKMTGFLRIKQKPTLSNKAFIPDNKKQIGVIDDKNDTCQSSLQSYEDELSNYKISSDSSSQPIYQQQSNSVLAKSPEQILSQEILKQQIQTNHLNKQQQTNQQGITLQQESEQYCDTNTPDIQKRQELISLLKQKNEHLIQNQLSNIQTIDTLKCQQIQNIESKNCINQSLTQPQEFHDETFGINKPLEDFIIQIPQSQQQQKHKQNKKNNVTNQSNMKIQQKNLQQSQIQQSHPNFQIIGQQQVQQYSLNQQYSQNYNQQYPSHNQYQMMNFFIGNTSSNTKNDNFFIGNTSINSKSENVSPINVNIPITLTQQISLQHTQLSQSQVGFQSGFTPSGTNSDNSSVVIDLRSPNTQNSTLHQNISELNSPLNLPFSPINQYEPHPNHYQSPYQTYQQQITKQQSTPNSNQVKKQPVKLPRYKPPIVIDTTIGGNFSHKKSTPNSDVQTNQNGSSGNGCGLGSGRSGSASNSQKNSTLSSRIFMMMDDENQAGLSLSQCGSSYNNSISSNTTSNQSSTKNNSTKNQSSCTNSLQQDIHNLPTTKVKPKYFNFPPDRTQFSNFLKQQIGEERFNKMKSILDNSSNPLKFLEGHPQLIADIIGEENMKLAYTFRYIISPQVTPSAGNHLRHKSFQGFDNQFPNQDSMIKNSGTSNSVHFSQNSNPQQQQQQLQSYQQQQQQQQLQMMNMNHHHHNYYQHHYMQPQVQYQQQSQPFNPMVNMTQLNYQQQQQNIFSPQQIIKQNYYMHQQQQQFHQQNLQSHPQMQNQQQQIEANIVIGDIANK